MHFVDLRAFGVPENQILIFQKSDKMKKIITLVLIGVSNLVLGQTDVYLKLNQKLDEAAFTYATGTSNNLEHAYSYTRLQYYISQITLTYDGGHDTLLTDTYFLIDAGQPFKEMLGTFNFNTLEAISFGIGVDTAKNHADPSIYSAGHALGHHSPSMHWGWAAGYRFAVLEGKTDQGQGWQLHALGDKNYGTATVITTGQMINNDLVIAVDANYEAALDDIIVNSTLNYHGEDNQTPVTLGNFQAKVFTAGDATFGIKDFYKVPQTFDLVPNPSSGDFEVEVDIQDGASYEVVVRDVSGREILNTPLHYSKGNVLSIQKAGVYAVSVLKNGQPINTKKLLIK